MNASASGDPVQYPWPGNDARVAQPDRALGVLLRRLLSSRICLWRCGWPQACLPWGGSHDPEAAVRRAGDYGHRPRLGRKPATAKARLAEILDVSPTLRYKLTNTISKLG